MYLHIFAVTIMDMITCIWLKIFTTLWYSTIIPELMLLNISILLISKIDFTHMCFAVTIMDMIIWLKIFTTFVVFHKVKMKRLVVNTTCLELARPSNQQLRLSCSNPSDYHCLLDDTFTKEFEVCREWKWIPGGKSRQLVLFKLWEHKSLAWMTS